MFSLPPLINMLKFGGSPCLLSGRKEKSVDDDDDDEAEGRRRQTGSQPPSSPRRLPRVRLPVVAGTDDSGPVRDLRSRPTSARPLGRSPGGRSLHNCGPRRRASGGEGPVPGRVDGRPTDRPTNQLSRRSKTDPEPDMDGGRASVRNVRSKCRCSHVLQFTFRRAVCCVLHRPPSQVIHCTVLSLKAHSASLSCNCRARSLVANL